LRGQAALDAWERLRRTTNVLDETDAAVFRVLPLVYRNLRAEGLAEGDLGPLKGVYRQSWYRTRLALASVYGVLDVLESAGVEPIALKGLGLMATIYAEPALRPMHDVDLLFRPGHYEAAVDAMLAARWRPLRGGREDFFRRIKVFHALPLVSGQGEGSQRLEVDMHRYMLEENCFPGADAPVFARLVRGSVGEYPITTLSPEDHVVNACVHGVRWDPTPALRWAPDAVTTIRAAGETFDWEYVVEEGRRRQTGLALAAALRYAGRFEPSIPRDAVSRLAAGAGRLERWDFRAQQAREGVAPQVARYLTRYARLSSHRSPWRKVADFPTYLECMWELDRPRQVPVDGARRIIARARGRIPARYLGRRNDGNRDS